MKYADKFLHYAIPAQKKFKKWYEEYDDGLISICSDYVQVTEEKFADLFKQFNGELNYTARKSFKQYHLEMRIDGVLFMTVGSKEELEKVGFSV